MTSDIIGIDEVGRGPWAGPLVACAVLLNRDISGLKDSKKLSSKRRAELSKIICSSAQFGLGWVPASEIDELGLSLATTKAMQRAYDQIEAREAEIVIDGNVNFLPRVVGTRTEVKAEDKYPSVAAASIVAKVKRDEYMALMATKYPGYGFESHAGYGTKQHKEAIAKLGLTPLHRRSFKPIRELL